MGTRENRLAEAVLTSTHNLCFEEKYEKYQTFLSENFQFLEVKFSIYFKRRVFVMDFTAADDTYFVASVVVFSYFTIVQFLYAFSLESLSPFWYIGNSVFCFSR